MRFSPSPRVRPLIVAIATATLMGPAGLRAEPLQPPSSPVPPPPPAPPVPRPEPTLIPPSAFSPTPLAAPHPFVHAEPPEPILLEVIPRFGTVARFGDPSGLPFTGDAAYTMGLSLGLALARPYTLELGYEHLGILTEGDANPTASLQVARTIDTGWAMLRASLFRQDALNLYLGFGAGFSVDRATAVGWGPGVKAFSCSATGPVSMAIRVGLGTEVRVARGLYFLADVSGTSDDASSAYMGTCAPGLGSINLVGVRGGFAYRFDVTRFVR